MNYLKLLGEKIHQNKKIIKNGQKREYLNRLKKKKKTLLENWFASISSIVVNVGT